MKRMTGAAGHQLTAILRELGFPLLHSALMVGMPLPRDEIRRLQRS